MRKYNLFKKRRRRRKKKKKKTSRGQNNVMMPIGTIHKSLNKFSKITLYITCEIIWIEAVTKNKTNSIESLLHIYTIEMNSIASNILRIYCSSILCSRCRCHL